MDPRVRARTSRLLVQLAPKQAAATIAYQEMSKAQKKASFEAYYRQFADELVAELSEFEMPDEAVRYIKRMIDYTLPGGKMNRGLSVITTYSHLVGNRPLTEDELCKASVLGWCVEWLQAYFLVADDVMDRSVTRRDQPCWYLNEDVGLIAVNDSFILESGVYRLLKKHFEGDAKYATYLELFHEVSYQTQLGQLLDLRTSPEGSGPTLDNFSLHKHHLVVKYKTAFYSFYLPVALGMTMAGITDSKLYDTARDILVDMGVYFQVQDDFLDWWQDPEVLGKVGTDIQDNKCSWPVVTVLDKCSAADRAVLEKHYARDDPASVEIVKNLYRKYDVEGVYNAYQDKMIAQLTARIAQVTDLPPAIFTDFLDKIAYRQK
ncbi:geranyltranstransferase [Thecamonas trahens ATCC 50062]|uniref:Geranyltranstransferase n=1 Tax=Thecamonas trahens ATCC 50062 TaxID=461836 RepID=A0A0L0D6Z1_THETB|nr:geranyltranstransferase [Thecamonas trahens ATCC 50062]KNC48109.1 geranyltranstransferase [Thecamonas trahens ATCC 50062]|eukprot:XP_013758682.1 geranyltranstransferase [Thecamonas trahens ATCC 50062]